jgi:amino acid adenylation domain-containing protein
MAKHTVSIQATRGCPYNCAFCHKIWPKKHVVRSAENIFKEIMNCYDAGIQRFVFIDDIFNLDIKNSTRLFKKIIQHQLDIQLFFPNGLRGDILTTDFIDLMIEAGTVNIDLALESASPRIQKLIGKNLNLEKFRENVRYIIGKYPQVLLEMELMVGFPTETEEEALMTLEFLKDLKWVHFPNLNILKIYPNTEMYRLAVGNGISVESIERSTDLAYHQLPETLPFSKDFAKEFQTRFMKEYFLLKERLLHVLPYQAANFTQDEILQKYDSYLPMEIKRFSDILQLVDGDIPGDKLTNLRFLPPHYRSAPNFSKNIKKYFPPPSQTKSRNAFRILLIDLSQLFSSQSKDQLYDVCVEPLGLMYLKTYLDKTFGQRVCGKVLKSRIDFDSFQELHHIISLFKPDLIGIRTLSCYKEFFHDGVLRMREWGIDVPIIAGGPYATSDYMFLLQDFNIDLAVLGEGELILAELVEKMMENGNKMPNEEVLKTTKGISFIKNKSKNRIFQKALKLNREVILLDKVPQKLIPYPGENIENPGDHHQDRGNDLVYVIYTSGSTGIPKAAALEHRNVVNLMEYMFKYTNIDCSRILQFATISFDASFHEIFSALLSGGKLYLITRETRGNIPDLFKYIEKNRIKTVFLPMSFLRTVFNDDEFIAIFPGCVTHIQTAGEQVIVSDKFRRYLKKHNVYLHNHYGPAEAHVVTALTIDPRGEIPSRPSIGKPLLNTDIYILDKGNQLLPPGVPGELYIGGIQVGRGYLNKPQLTAEKFCLRRPGGTLLKGLKVPGKRNYMSYMSHMSYLYRTGDLARWLPDGNIEFLGRIDNQVKIRGFRIEPGEIEKCLMEIDHINEAVVIDRKNENSEKYLCAYIVTTYAGSPLTASTPPALDTGELIETLSGKLPDYMIPAYFVLLDKIPLTPNGKLNRKALPEPATRTTGEYTTPRDELEKKLAEIWGRVLNRQTPIGIDDNFFQLGGHSLKAVIMTAKVHKELEIKISLTELFKRPTIRAMAEYTRKTAKAKFASPQALENKEYYPLSSAQTRMFFLNQMEGIGTAYNLPVVTEIRGKPDKHRFEKSFLQLIHRHESLRTSFLLKNETPIQVAHREVDFQLDNIKAAEQEIPDVIAGFIKPFNLDEAPLFRVGLVELTGGKYLLLLDMHHIISDGISMVILIREFIHIYEGRALPQLQIQYKDYSKWQEHLFDTPGFKKQEDYWLDRFKGELPILKLPTDYSRPSIQCFDGESTKFQLEEELTGMLRKIAADTDTTLFMVLLAAFDILLAKYARQEDIVVGIPAAGRNHPDLEHLIGLCVNTLAIRNYVDENLSFREFLEQVKKNALDAYENQDYPIEMLINKLEISKELSQNPLFNVLFVSENLDFPELKIDELTFRPYAFEYKISHLDLVFYFTEDDPGINMTLEYASALFKPSSIEKMIDHYIEILDQVGEDHRRILKDITISHQLTVPDANIFQEAQVDFAF